ncbi:MAG: sel1 repeat family protein [Bacteroidaceae bacterium]|nr:sel1 repeat family protein [Bacteroidaceae bacterium]
MRTRALTAIAVTIICLLSGCTTAYEKGAAAYKEMNFTEAVKHYKEAAEQGDAEAQNALGACYKNGEGVEKDHAEAAKWYRKAAEQGHALAQNSLGYCYLNGNGVEKDLEEAFKWFKEAAKQGHPLAIKYLEKYVK